MLVKTISALAALALAANVVAEPMPYKPKVMKMSARQLFGVVRRDDNPGYQPTQAVCGVGSTCEEACGAGFVPCASKDNEVHCFVPTAGELCCPNMSGDSCDAGYYCTSDKKDETWCCPDGMGLDECAAKYEIEGGLTAQTAPASSSVASTTSSAAPSSSIVSSNATVTQVSSSSFSLEPISTSTSNSTVRITSSPSPTSASDAAEGAGSFVAPAGALALVMAGFAALL